MTKSRQPESLENSQQGSLFGDATDVTSAKEKKSASKKTAAKRSTRASGQTVSVPVGADGLLEGPQPSESDSGQQYWTVSDITQWVKQSFSQHAVLGNRVVVRGELSNVNPSSRGHVYFKLKDASSAIGGVIWASRASKLSFDLDDGQEVYVTGTLDVYAPSGTYSLVAERIDPVGIGALQLAFEQLKARLTEEGLFDDEHKQPLPLFPSRIGIVTAKTGAVIHDMLRVIRRKCPQVSVVLAPVSVQGKGAAQSIAQAITELSHPAYGLDVMIVGRGGGSFEDLFCFSEEPVVRAMFESPVPIIAGVGHEPDFSLADAVADMTCSTPTAAAEAAVPDMSAVQAYVDGSADVLAKGLSQALIQAEQQLDRSVERLRTELQACLMHATQRVNRSREVLLQRGQDVLLPYQQRLDHLSESLTALSPQATFERGFWALTRKGVPVTTGVQGLCEGDDLTLHAADGSARVTVQRIFCREPE